MTDAPAAGDAAPAALTFDALDKAWWDWVNANCPSASPSARGRWMHANVFTFDGTTWRRDRGSMRSNSGKTTRTTSVTFVGSDGRVIGHDHGVALNRRNDPARDFRLPD